MNKMGNAKFIILLLLVSNALEEGKFSQAKLMFKSRNSTDADVFTAESISLGNNSKVFKVSGVTACYLKYLGHQEHWPYCSWLCQKLL